AKYRAAIVAPVVSEGDVFGCVMFITAEGIPNPGETEYKLAQTIAGFLSRQMES
ncbi:MAG: stage V sporulation T C-terminal domain-containing protein, partial [Eubacteriales bacterium]